MNNLELIKQKIDDLISLLQSVGIEAEEIEQKRIALEATEKALTLRQNQTVQKEQEAIKRKKELDEQSEYIEMQLKKDKKLKEDIVFEKEQLGTLQEELGKLKAREFEISETEKALTIRQREYDAIDAEKKTIAREKLILIEQRKQDDNARLLLKQKEDDLNTREERIKTIETLIKQE